MDLSQMGAALGSIVVAAGTILGGGYAWWLKNKRAEADTRADVAISNANGAVADAQQAVYRLMQERLTTLENDMRAVREELNVERKHSRNLELHIFRLESIMRRANLEVPVMEARG